MASNPAWHTCILIASALRMLEAIGEILVQNLHIHATADMLSHQIATLAWYRALGSTACSSAIQCINIPINSRSDIDIRPVGFVAGKKISDFLGPL